MASGADLLKNLHAQPSDDDDDEDDEETMSSKGGAVLNGQQSEYKYPTVCFRKMKKKKSKVIHAVADLHDQWN
jgi:hypothetical protein